MAKELNKNIHIELFHTIEEWEKEWADDPNEEEIPQLGLTSYHIIEVESGKINLRDDVWYWLIGDRVYETLKYVKPENRVIYKDKLPSMIDDKIREWFNNNFQVHTDWTGDWIEYHQHSTSVEEIAERLVQYLNP